MNLILITCCAKKAPGGILEYQPSPKLRDCLSEPSYQQLMEARRELAKLVHVTPGPDLGAEGSKSSLNYLPAYKRYQGIMYRAGDVDTLYSQGKAHLTIISALYGLLDAEELIHEYDLTMHSKINMHTVGWFWKQRELGRIVCEYINFLKPEYAHDLLSKLYREVIVPWPDCLQEGVGKKVYQFPGKGMRMALDRRGEILKSLLSGH